MPLEFTSVTRVKFELGSFLLFSFSFCFVFVLTYLIVILTSCQLLFEMFNTNEVFPCRRDRASHCWLQFFHLNLNPIPYSFSPSMIFLKGFVQYCWSLKLFIMSSGAHGKGILKIMAVNILPANVIFNFVLGVLWRQ